MENVLKMPSEMEKVLRFDCLVFFKRWCHIINLRQQTCCVCNECTKTFFLMATDQVVTLWFVISYENVLAIYFHYSLMLKYDARCTVSESTANGVFVQVYH